MNFQAYIQFIQFWRLQIPIHWVILIAALLITFLTVYFVYKEKRAFRQAFADTLFTIIIIIFIVYKLSYFLTDPSAIWKSPLSVVYFDGGLLGLILGFFISIFYFFSQWRKHKWERNLVYQGLIISLGTLSATLYFLHILYRFVAAGT